ncbi:MAG: sigma-54 interaction domain-containing protein [Thiotrichales bacterium]
MGESRGLKRVRGLLDAVAPSDMTVLVHGESGVGKELIARELHFRSDRRDKNFVALDCCTLQESLFETELFGHEKGAFTGADRRKEGLIDVAEGGTLFLDEIGEIGPGIQAKLLRVLETGQFRRVGISRDLTADVRIVAATNRTLEEMAEQGEFRRDLFYRLNAFTITMPPLRDRREDIPILTRHFIENHDFSRRIVKQLNIAALRQMKAYNWPGNVRELRNVIERAIILSRDRKEIRPSDLAFCRSGSELQGCEVSLDFEHEPSLEEIEKKYLAMLLEKFSGHRGKIARTMGISERSVYRMIQRYKLQI